MDFRPNRQSALCVEDFVPKLLLHKNLIILDREFDVGNTGLHNG
jgi:hypothetical protein